VPEKWECVNVHEGLSDPYTTAVGKAQLAYTIAEPQSKTYDDNDNDEETPEVDLTSSVILITGDDDTDADSIELMAAGAGYDGLLITFRAYSSVDINDPFSIDVEGGDSACVNCPYGGEFFFYGVGAYLTVRYEHGVGYHLVDYYHPPTDWFGTASITGIDEFDSSSFLEISIRNDKVAAIYRISGEADGTTVDIAMPFTAKDRSEATMTTRAYAQCYDDAAGKHGMCELDENGTDLDFHPGASNSTTWTNEDNDPRLIAGQFFYVAE